MDVKTTHLNKGTKFCVKITVADLVVTNLSIRYLRREILWDNDVVLKVVLGFIKGGCGLLLLNKPFTVAQGANKGLSVLYV
jgi:hypothetical protein